MWKFLAKLGSQPECDWEWFGTSGGMALQNSLCQSALRAELYLKGSAFQGSVQTQVGVQGSPWKGQPFSGA